MKEQIEKTPGKFMELSNYIEKSGTLLNNLDILIKKINVANIPVELGKKNINNVDQNH